VLTLALFIAGHTTTSYLKIITPHNADGLISDNVQVLEGSSYGEAGVFVRYYPWKVICGELGLGYHEYGGIEDFEYTPLFSSRTVKDQP
jgi:hypothetical protein